MQKINTMELTRQITWGLKPPFTVNLVHLVRSVCSVQPGPLDTAGTQYSQYTR